MNAGMFGQASGDFGERKVTQQTGRITGGTTPAGSSVTGLANFTLSAPGVAANTRTAVYSATGKGAARFFLLGHASVAATVVVEIEVDGRVILSNSMTTSVAGERALVGVEVISSGRITALALDYIPFKSSFTVYVTPTALMSSGSLRWTYLMEAHE